MVEIDFRLLTRETVVNDLMVSESTLKRWEKQGILRPIKIGRGRNAKIRYKMSDLVALARVGK